MIFAMITGDMFTFSIIYIIFLFGFSQAFHFIMKSTDAEGMYANYMTTWIALFHMTLGEYEANIYNSILPKSTIIAKAFNPVKGI